jgi:hypothetical protein
LVDDDKRKERESFFRRIPAGVADMVCEIEDGATATTGCSLLKFLQLAVIAFLFGIIAPTSSARAVETVQTLFEECNSEHASPEGFHCLGVIEGIAVVMHINGALYRSGKGGAYLAAFSTCSNGPPGPTTGEYLENSFGSCAMARKLNSITMNRNRQGHLRRHRREAQHLERRTCKTL